jgi:hypothetical protein
MSRPDPAAARPRHAPKAIASGASGAGLLLADDLLVLFGEAEAGLPVEAQVCLGGPAEPQGSAGTWRARQAQELGPSGPRPFVAVAQLAGVARAQVTGLVLAAGQEADQRWLLPPLARLGLHPMPLARHLTESGLDAGMTFGFLATALFGGRGVEPLPPHRAQTFLRELLEHAGEPQGFLEVLAAPECGGLLIQGWCARLPSAADANGSGELPAVLESDSGALEATRMMVAAFPRDDVLAPAVGIVAFARTDGGIAPEQVRALHLADGRRFCRLEVSPAHRTVLEPVVGTLHLRRMLPPPGDCSKRLINLEI